MQFMQKTWAMTGERMCTFTAEVEWKTQFEVWKEGSVKMRI